jgi:arylsulfatase A-like enzyme
MYAKSTFEAMGRDPGPRDVVGSLRKFAAGVSAIDDRIPPLVTKLKERGLRDNTLVVFCGVNGLLLGRHGLWGDGQATDPVNMYEEVIQVPMIWTWPGRVPVESVRNELVSIRDAIPALCDATGAPAPEGRNLSGRSYTALAFGKPLPKKHPWRNLIFGEYRNTRMVRDSRYKLVSRNQGKGPNELFDLTVDPREKVNRFDNPGFISIRDQLQRQMG